MKQPTDVSQRSSIHSLLGQVELSGLSSSFSRQQHPQRRRHSHHFCLCKRPCRPQRFHGPWFLSCMYVCRAVVYFFSLCFTIPPWWGWRGFWRLVGRNGTGLEGIKRFFNKQSLDHSHSKQSEQNPRRLSTVLGVGVAEAIYTTVCWGNECLCMHLSFAELVHQQYDTYLINLNWREASRGFLWVMEEERMDNFTRCWHV